MRHVWFIQRRGYEKSGSTAPAGGRAQSGEGERGRVAEGEGKAGRWRGGGGWDTAGELTRRPRLAPGKDAGSAAAISASFRAVAARVGAVVWGAG